MTHWETSPEVYPQNYPRWPLCKKRNSAQFWTGDHKARFLTQAVTCAISRATFDLFFTAKTHLDRPHVPNTIVLVDQWELFVWIQRNSARSRALVRTFYLSTRFVKWAYLWQSAPCVIWWVECHRHHGPGPSGWSLANLLMSAQKSITAHSVAY